MNTRSCFYIYKYDCFTASTSTAIRCDSCNVEVPRHAYAGHRKSLMHKMKSCRNLEDGVEVVDSAFKKRIISYRVSPVGHHISYKEFFDEVADKIKYLIREEIRKHRSIKVNLELFGLFVHQVKELREIKSFNTANKILNEGSDLNSIYDDFAGNIESKAIEFQERESGKSIKMRFV